jgi:3,4-dihydroxy 2-butanone 4-phosphate synthase/GTP cyclohydrolase II
MTKMKRIINDLQAGKFVILQDDEHRENEADLIIAAEHITIETLNFMLREAGGFICLSLTGEILDKLQIPQMVKHNNSQFNTPFAVSVEAAAGVTTGVSAADRVHTIKTIIADNAIPSDIVMPGHILPLRARENGVFSRDGHTEGSVDLMKLSGLKGAAVICELMNADGSMMRGQQVAAFAKQHQFAITDIASVRQHRLQHETLITELANCQLPIIDNILFTCTVYRDEITKLEHVVLSSPQLSAKPLVRIHSKCITGDVLQSNRCDCGEQLKISLAMLCEQGGLLFYLEQEGRGIGLINKIKSYALQQQGYDSVEANHQLGFPDDLRDYTVVAAILRQLGLKQISLLTNNPRKINALEGFGIEVERVPLQIKSNPANHDYLLTKKNKLSHLLNLEH